jgi:hypothetical protein
VVTHAQQTLGSVNGTVLDASGAAVPGTTVTVTDADINVTRTAKTQPDGFFQIFNLPIGTYKVVATHDGFDTAAIAGIAVREAAATTVPVTLKVGQVSESVEVIGSPLLNATDNTNGYTLDSDQIATLPLGATGSFTDAAKLAPGVNTELLANLDSNAGIGNQPIWANGQRDTSNTFQVNGVDATNLFNGKSSSGANSQRYAFNIGQSAGIGGAAGVGTSVFGSNGNSLPSPPPEFIQELRVNTAMYDAQQGATAGAQIDVNTLAGTNVFHGQVYGTFANNGLNADPFFFKQQALLKQNLNIGSFPINLENPALHRWTTGGTVGGPIKKDKLFFFAAYQHRYNSDQATGLSQLYVPYNLTDDRSAAGLTAVATAWNNGKAYTGAQRPVPDPVEPGQRDQVPLGSSQCHPLRHLAAHRRSGRGCARLRRYPRGSSLVQVLLPDRSGHETLHRLADSRLPRSPAERLAGRRPRQHHSVEPAPELGAAPRLRPHVLLQRL